MARNVAERRLDRHRAFVEQRRADGESFEYDAEQYGFPVVTKQKRRLRLYTVEAIERTETGYELEHAPFEG